MRKIPPFRDAHMHFIEDGRPAVQDRVREIGAWYVRSGVFAARDMGHRSGSGLGAKEILETFLHVESAGYALYRKGTYGSFLGKGVSGEDEIRRAVGEAAHGGADFIKVINSGVVDAKAAGSVTEGGFTYEELKIIAGEAKARGLEVICHANSDAAIRNAVRAGALSIEHGYFVSDETLHMMAGMQVSWTPTVVALVRASAAMASGEKRLVEEVIDKHLAAIHCASSIGVKLNVGTDSGSRGIVHGEAFLDELELFRKAGLTFEQILSAACMGREEIEKGNYLVVEEDFIASRTIAAIYKDGMRMK
ncbi:MAG TPA: amidohydrolase family protein [Dissulfurispiraceae bacterium]